MPITGVQPPDASLAAETMDSSQIPALAALIGASIGGLTSVLTSWLLHQRQVRVQWVAEEANRRRKLYKEFIEDASKCYADALQHDTGDIPGLVALHATIGRMRILSSPTVMARAEKVRRKILDTYLEPDKSFPELRELVRAEGDSVDLLREFSEACREEFATLRTIAR
jgi:hypothetical protein